MSSNEVDTTALDPRPKPWIVALGVPPESELAQALLSCGGTVRFTDRLSNVRLVEDFDFVVLNDVTSQNVPAGVSVLQFLPRTHGGGRTISAYDNLGAMNLANGSRAEQFEIAHFTSTLGLRALIDDTILKAVPLGGAYDVLYHNSTGHSEVAPMVSEKNGHPLAAVIVRETGRSWWILPTFTTKRGHWFSTVLALWRSAWPDAFPPPPIGAQRMWQTPAEHRALDRVKDYDAETRRLVSERAAELQRLKDEAESLQRIVDRNERMVVTTTGTDLEQAVASTLTSIGFKVQDSDAQADAAGKAKRQDLEVTSATAPGWVALAEVKGYAARSAKTSDIAQLERAAGFYTKDTGAVPDSLWYVVNANYDKEPDKRAVPLQSSPDDVEVFAEDGGVVIDTRQLFLLARAVEAGTCTSEQAQQSLITATGIYFAPDPPVGGATPG